MHSEELHTDHGQDEQEAVAPALRRERGAARTALTPTAVSSIDTTSRIVDSGDPYPAVSAADGLISHTIENPRKTYLGYRSPGEGRNSPAMPGASHVGGG